MDLSDRGAFGHGPPSRRAFGQRTLSVNRLLHAQGYSLQRNRKMLEGRQHLDRDAHFQHLS